MPRQKNNAAQVEVQKKPHSPNALASAIGSPAANPWPPNMTMKGWMRWQENRWKMHDRQVAWIREQKRYAEQQGNDKLRHSAPAETEGMKP